MFSLILKMAYANAFARLSRTLLLIVMIAVSMSMMLSIQGLYDGMLVNMLDKNKRSASGDVGLFVKDHRLKQDIKENITHADEIAKEIADMKGVKALVVRVDTEGLASTARKSSFANIVGVDLEAEEAFGMWSDFVKKGELRLDKRGVLVGLELAKTLKVRIGSKVIFSSQDTHGEINSIALKVRGIVQTTNMGLDNSALFVDIKKVRKFLGIEASHATKILVMLDDPKAEQTLKQNYASLDVESFLEQQPVMQQMQEFTAYFNAITFSIVMIVVFVGILGVMYVSILDRIREFGIIQAVGMQYKYIRWQITLEALIVSLCGYVLGSLMGVGMLGYLMEYGLNLSEFSDALEMYGYEPIIYATMKLSYFTTTFFAIVLASLLSIILPLRKIKKLHPIDVIKADT
jgi:ABC-type lipoprotein release transport system permease subunit